MSGWQKLWQDPEIAKRWRDRPPAPAVVAMADRLQAEGRRRVLDIGCGIGRHTVYLAARGFEVTAVDNAPAALEACRKNLTEAGLLFRTPGGALQGPRRGRATVLEAEMTRLPFADAAFDGVVAAQVIHHTDRATLRRIIAAITRMLAPPLDDARGGPALLSGGDPELVEGPRGYFAWATPSRRHSECGHGREVEPGTWVDPDHREGPVPHHYVSEQEIGELLDAYEIESLEEREQPGDRGPRFHWDVLARRKV